MGSASQTRQITNVAAGTSGTDAVNLSQLNAKVAAVSAAVDARFAAMADTTTSSTGAESAHVGLASSNLASTSTASSGLGLVSGSGAYAAGAGDIAVGTNARVLADNGTALGTNTFIDATSPGAVALGAGATVAANAANSVALGAGSIASAPNTVSVGSAGAERRITNVAAGINPTDAVNVGQLDGYIFSNNRQVDQLRDGVALALASSGAPGLLPGKRFALSANAGGFQGSGAFSAGATALLFDNKDYAVVLSGGVGFGFDTNVLGGHGGVSIQW